MKILNAKTIEDNGTWLCLLVENPPQARKFVADKKDKPYRAELKEWREKRSLDANNYAWLLIGKIADVLRTSKDEIYLEMLKRYGQGAVVKIPNNSVDMFKKAYKYHEKHESLPDEEKAQYYRFWVGSSNYNTQEMSVLIDGIVSECKELNIETLTPMELDRIKEEWK